MSDYDDVIARLKEEGLDAEAAVLEKYSANQLRDKASQAEGLEKRVADLEAENKKLQAGPKREAALRAAGVDIGALSPADVEVLDAQRLEDGKEPDEEWARGLIEKYQLPITTRVESGPMPAAAEMVTAATATGGRVVAKTTLSPADVAAWDDQKRMQFVEWCNANDSDAFDRLLAGETVTGITF